MWDFLKGLIAPAVNFFSGLITNNSNKKQTEDTNAANMAMNAQNIQFQKDENEIARQREDTAVQRRAADLTAAGLSKTLAAGSPASANAMNAPNNQFGMQAARFDAPKFDYDYAAVKHNLAAADALAQNAETEATKAQTEKDRLEFEREKFEQEHGFEVKKWSDEFEFTKTVKYRELDLADKNYELDKGKLFLSAVELNDKLKNSMTDREYKQYQIGYTEALTIAAQNEDKRKQTLLKYDLAEATARIYNYAMDYAFTGMQMEIIKEQLPILRVQLKTALMEHLKLKADTANSVADAMTKMYNLFTAKREGSKTNDTVVSSSVASENKHARHTELAAKGIQSVSSFLSVGIGAFIGSGGASHLIDKMLGMDQGTLGARKK